MVKKFILVFILFFAFFLGVYSAIQIKSSRSSQILSKNLLKISNENSLKNIISLNEINNSNLSILVVKHQYLLFVLNNNDIIKSYPIVLGSNPMDDKLREGDGCTPEGTFKIRSKYPHAKWSKFMWIDYPNETSFKKFKQAKKDKINPANATIGGEVGIHGVKTGFDFLITTKFNWTKGCISLKRKDVDELYDAIPINTLVVIKK